jgi:hypothetical protein
MSNMYRDDVDGDYVTYADHRAAITPLVRALRETLAAAVTLSDIGCSGAEYRSAKSKLVAARALLDEYKGIA